MHEFSLATEIVETVKEFAEQKHPQAIQKVCLRIGELTRVEASQLRFCFNSLTRETVLEATTLEIERVAARVRCTWCRYQGPPKYTSATPATPALPLLECPHCGRPALALEGHECEIKAIHATAPNPSELAECA